MTTSIMAQQRSTPVLVTYNSGKYSKSVKSKRTHKLQLEKYWIQPTDAAGRLASAAIPWPGEMHV